MTRTALPFVVGFAIAAAVAGGCNRKEATPNERTLTVFAASSLRDVFTGLGKRFEAANPGVKVTFHFAGTQELRTQLEHGAKADVLASADERHMAALHSAERVLAPVVFARNEPVIIVGPRAKDLIRGLEDLPKASRLVIGAAEVPIGRYTVQVLERAKAELGEDFRARVEAKIVSRELNVRQVLTRVRLGEADAGIVYRSDAQVAPELSVVTIPQPPNVAARYPIARVKGAKSPNLADAFIATVLADDGQAALQQAGFSTVPAPTFTEPITP